MQFVVAIEPGNAKQAYGVVVPDLPGCFSAGDTLEEAFRNAHEAIVFHLEELGAETIGKIESSKADRYASEPEFKGWLWGLIDIDDRLFGDKTERINITVPARKLVIIDKAAAQAGKARSEYLVEGAVARAMDDLYGARKSATVVRKHGALFHDLKPPVPQSNYEQREIERLVKHRAPPRSSGQTTSATSRKSAAKSKSAASTGRGSTASHKKR